ncbi:MAG: radical SAM protein [Nanoarchaeota archaeon]
MGKYTLDNKLDNKLDKYTKLDNKLDKYTKLDNKLDKYTKLDNKLGKYAKFNAESSAKLGSSTKLSFKTLSFRESNFQENKERRNEGNNETDEDNDGTDDMLQVNLLKLFSAEIPLDELNKIGPVKIRDAHTLEFAGVPEEKAQTRFLFLLSASFKELKNRLTGNTATYVHKNSGIPLIGNVSFGIVYRNSSIIEIKPVTSCNLNCIYCSISEGLESKKHDFVVEKDYLLEELQKLISFVSEQVEVHIGVQGEPFLYAGIEELIADLQAMKNVQAISIDTNGTLLSREIIARLAKNDKLQLNFSLDSLNEQKAKEIAGINSYNVNHIKELIAYACKKLKRVVIAPVYVPGYNDKDLEDIILFVKSITPQPVLGIQNFLSYKTGRNPLKSNSVNSGRGIPWNKFYPLLENLEKKHSIKLIWTKEDFGVRKTKELPKPFKEGDVVNAVIKCPDRFPNTSIAAAGGRSISLLNCLFRAGKAEKKVKVKIVKEKHNIFTGKVIK